MQPGDRNEMPTLAEAVGRAAAICDPEGGDWATRVLVEALEDDDRPASAVEELPELLASTVRGIDPEGDSPAAAMAAATATWLATNGGDDGERERVLREAARLGFGEQVPAAVEAWLAEQGVGL